MALEAAAPSDRPHQLGAQGGDHSRQNQFQHPRARPPRAPGRVRGWPAVGDGHHGAHRPSDLVRPR